MNNILKRYVIAKTTKLNTVLAINKFISFTLVSRNMCKNQLI